jgi:tRNA dimethylallyltransferase
MAELPVIDVIAGPTASGKTACALRWAEEAGAEIVSADALLFYRGMDIGTAKPSKDDRARVPHHLIDVCEVSEAYDIARYVEAARAAIDDILSRGKRVIVAGGSGFYLKAFFSPVADSVKVPDEIRDHVRSLEQRQGLEGLRNTLLALEPAPPASLDLANPRRVARALERRLASGRPLADLEAEFKSLPCPFAHLKRRLWVIAQDPEVLEKRIHYRTGEMLRSGLVQEVRDLLARGLENNPTAASAIGYRETLAHLRGELTESELPDAINQATRRLVRKQQSWLRNQLPRHTRITPESPLP